MPLMSNRLRRGIPLLVLSCALAGCATKALWDHSAFDGFNEPAHPANLQVFKTKDDWLVRYDEVNENTDRVHHRAYYLNANTKQVRDHTPPMFCSRSLPPGTTLARTSVSTNGQEFALYDGDMCVGIYELPVYAAPSGRVKQVLLTPCTMAADATIVGGFIAVYFWLPAGAPGLAE